MPQIEWGTCHAPNCDEPAPWDMVAILVGQHACCSPECAKRVAEDLHKEKPRVSLHDPQYAADRPDVLDDDVVDIHRTTDESATEKIDAVAALYPGQWRVSMEDGA